jgi:hypothetical protein
LALWHSPHRSFRNLGVYSVAAISFLSSSEA